MEVTGIMEEKERMNWAKAAELLNTLMIKLELVEDGLFKVSVEMRNIDGIINSMFPIMKKLGLNLADKTNQEVSK